MYEKILSGLALVARHAAKPLLEALLAWRKSMLEQAIKASGQQLVLRKRVGCIPLNHHISLPTQSGT